jgi:hypothetical protein
MGEWLLSRRDRLIVAGHFVPGCDVERPRPGGTVEVIVSPRVLFGNSRPRMARDVPSGFNIGTRTFAENIMNIERAKGVGHRRYILAFRILKYCFTFAHRSSLALS